MMKTPSTFVVFPNYVADVSGVAYVDIGPRVVRVTMRNGYAAKFLRSALPAELPQGNDLAFVVGRIVDAIVSPTSA
jgi:hypothetical protein